MARVTASSAGVARCCTRLDWGASSAVPPNAGTASGAARSDPRVSDSESVAGSSAEGADTRDRGQARAAQTRRAAPPQRKIATLVSSALAAWAERAGSSPAIVEIARARASATFPRRLLMKPIQAYAHGPTQPRTAQHHAISVTLHFGRATSTTGTNGPWPHPCRMYHPCEMDDGSPWGAPRNGSWARSGTLPVVREWDHRGAMSR